MFDQVEKGEKNQRKYDTAAMVTPPIPVLIE